MDLELTNSVEDHFYPPMVPCHMVNPTLASGHGPAPHIVNSGDIAHQAMVYDDINLIRESQKNPPVVYEEHKRHSSPELLYQRYCAYQDKKNVSGMNIGQKEEEADTKSKENSSKCHESKKLKGASPLLKKACITQCPADGKSRETLSEGELSDNVIYDD